MGSYLLFLSYFVWTQIKPDIVPALIFDTLMIIKKKKKKKKEKKKKKKKKTVCRVTSIMFIHAD